MDDSKYEIVGDWNCHVRQPMDKSGDYWTFEVTLPKPGGTFNIVRDGDMHQVIHPDKPSALPSDEVFGPDSIFEVAPGSAWDLQGMAGDKFRITFKRSLGPDFSDLKTVDWVKTGHEDLTREELNQNQVIKYSIAGSWTGFAEQHELEETPAKSAFGEKVSRAVVRVKNGVEESF